MQPLVRAAVFAALVAAVGSFGLTKPKAVDPVDAGPKAMPVPAAPPVAVSCGPFQLPEGDACIPIPRAGMGQPDAPGALDHVPRALREHGEVIPRRPDRPADVGLYRFPLAEGVNPVVLAGLDLPPGTVPDVDVGPASVLLGASNGDEVVVVTLEGQEGAAEIVFVGDLVGTTVITAHTVREGGRLRQMLLVHGYLAQVSDRAIEGSSVDDGDVIGYVGSLSAGHDVLYVEARQVREGTNLSTVGSSKLIDDSKSIAIDVRNVLHHGASL